MKKYLLFIGLIITGIIIGKISFLINNDLMVRLLLTVSDNLLVLLKIISPILILVISAVGISTIKGTSKNRVVFIMKLFGVVAFSMFILGMIVFALSEIIVKHLVITNNIGESIYIDSFYTLPIKVPSILNFYAIVIGIVSGLMFGEESKVMLIFIKIQNIIYMFFSKVILRIMPIWIISAFAKTAYLNTAGGLFLTDLLLSTYILILQGMWLIFMYWFVSIAKKLNFKKVLKYGFEIFGYVVSLGGQGTTVVIPYIVKKQEELNYDSAKAKVVTATSFNMPGSLISNIVFIIGVSEMFGMNIPVHVMLGYILFLIYLMIIAPSIPGGVSAVVAPTLGTSLGFTPDMVGVYQSMYFKQGTSNSALNNASDLYITPWL